jgi:hypothetical protein
VSGKLQQRQHSSLENLAQPTSAGGGLSRQRHQAAGFRRLARQHVVLPKDTMHQIARTHAVSSLFPARTIKLPATHASALAGQDVRK